MVQTQIDFEELEQKTSAEFVKNILRSVELVGKDDTFQDKRQIIYKQDDSEYFMEILVCFHGNFEKHRYFYGSGAIDNLILGWHQIDEINGLICTYKDMKKNVTHRIAYYLKKVAEKGSVHPAKKLPRSYTYRNERLKLYKKLMHREIEASGYIVHD